MGTHGDYSLTSTTTSMRFGAEALLAIVRRRQREAPGSTRLLIDQDDWFAAHRETAGVTYDEMSAAARAGFEHGQDALVDYAPNVVREVVEGPTPRTALSVTIFWPDSAGAPSHFSYRDTLSVPRVEVYDDRVVRFKLLAYDDMLVFDQVSGISVKPLGFMSGIFSVLGKPDLKQTRIAVSGDQWQVMRGQVNVFAGISKTGTAAIDPAGGATRSCRRTAPTSARWWNGSSSRSRCATENRAADDELSALTGPVAAAPHPPAPTRTAE